MIRPVDTTNLPMDPKKLGSVGDHHFLGSAGEGELDAGCETYAAGGAWDGELEVNRSEALTDRHQMGYLVKRGHARRATNREIRETIGETRHPIVDHELVRDIRVPAGCSAEGTIFVPRTLLLFKYTCPRKNGFDHTLLNTHSKRLST